MQNLAVGNSRGGEKTGRTERGRGRGGGHRNRWRRAGGGEYVRKEDCTLLVRSPSPQVPDRRVYTTLRSETRVKHVSGRGRGRRGEDGGGRRRGGRRGRRGGKREGGGERKRETGKAEVGEEN